MTFFNKTFSGAFDKAFDKAVETSQPVQSIAVGLKACAEQIKALVETITNIAYTQAVHHHMITQMWSMQQQIFQKLNASALDASMPDIKNGNTKKVDKPS